MRRQKRGQLGAQLRVIPAGGREERGAFVRIQNDGALEKFGKPLAVRAVSFGAHALSPGSTIMALDGSRGHLSQAFWKRAGYRAGNKTSCLSLGTRRLGRRFTFCSR